MWETIRTGMVDKMKGEAMMKKGNDTSKLFEGGCSGLGGRCYGACGGDGMPPASSGNGNTGNTGNAGDTGNSGETPDNGSGGDSGEEEEVIETKWKYRMNPDWRYRRNR